MEGKRADAGEPECAGAGAKMLRFTSKPAVRFPGASHSNVVSTFLVAHAASNNASCIIDPLKVLPRVPLEALRVGKSGAETLKSPRGRLNAINAAKAAANKNAKAATAAAPVTAAAATSTEAQACNFSAPFMAAIGDEDYLEPSDIEAEVDTDAEAYPEPDHYVKEAKSKDSLLNVLYQDTLASAATVKDAEAPPNDGDRSEDRGDDRSVDLGATSLNCVIPERASLATPLNRCVELVSSTPARSYRLGANRLANDCVATSSAEDSSEHISKLIVDLIGPNSRVGKLIFSSCGVNQETDGIYEEIRQCVQAELQMEDKLANFRAHATPALTAESLRHLDDTLAFVKEHLTLIRADLNEFKENTEKKIEMKVSQLEFQDTTAILRAKMTYLERKLFNEHRMMRQDIRNFREKINFLENEAACGFKNFPIWPFLAFIGAYSIVSISRR